MLSSGDPAKQKISSKAASSLLSTEARCGGDENASLLKKLQSQAEHSYHERASIQLREWFLCRVLDLTKSRR